MLYFIHKEGMSSSHFVGTKYRHLLPNSVIEVQADGHELSAILTQIKGIPTAPEQANVKWFGDDAKFIAANLRL